MAHYYKAFYKPNKAWIADRLYYVPTAAANGKLRLQDVAIPDDCLTSLTPETKHFDSEDQLIFVGDVVQLKDQILVVADRKGYAGLPDGALLLDWSQIPSSKYLRPLWDYFWPSALDVDPQADSLLELCRGFNKYHNNWPVGAARHDYSYSVTVKGYTGCPPDTVDRAVRNASGGYLKDSKDRYVFERDLVLLLDAKTLEIVPTNAPYLREGAQIEVLVPSFCPYDMLRF